MLPLLTTLYKQYQKYLTKIVTHENTNHKQLSTSAAHV